MIFRESKHTIHKLYWIASILYINSSHIHSRTIHLSNHKSFTSPKRNKIEPFIYVFLKTLLWQKQEKMRTWSCTKSQLNTSFFKVKTFFAEIFFQRTKFAYVEFVWYILRFASTRWPWYLPSPTKCSTACVCERRIPLFERSQNWFLYSWW